MTKSADLHIHSTHSDGLLTTEKIFFYAQKRKLKAISITDHDSVGVNAEANIGINSTFNTATKYFTIDGCAGISLTLYGEQCLGLGVCSDACVKVDVGNIALSAVIKGDSNGDLDYSLQKKQCSDCD